METKYVIRRGHLFLANHPSMQHWTEDRDRAMVFEFMTIAVGVAVMALDSVDYTIEAIA